MQNLQTHDIVDNYSNGPGRMPDKHDRNRKQSEENDDDNRSNGKSDDDDDEGDDSEDTNEDEEMLPISKLTPAPVVIGYRFISVPLIITHNVFPFNSYD